MSEVNVAVLKSTDAEYAAQVEAQIVVLKSAANEVQKQEAAQKLWTLAESRNREEEVARQGYIIKEGAAKPLIGLLKEGNEESKWRAARALVQLAFGNEETSTRLSKTKVINTVAKVLQDLDGCTDRIKETSLQLLNNIASNCWTCHEAIIAADILGHVIVILRSITVPDPVKRSAVNLVFSLSFTEEGRAALMEVDAAACLVPIIRANKTSINSICATLAVANLVGHRVRAQMLQGCGVVEKVLKALEHSLNREPMGGYHHSLWKVVLAFQELCKSDTHKESLVRENGVSLLARLMDLSPERQSDRNLVFGCTAVWHLAFNGQAKALLCEEAVLCERMEEIALADNHVAMQEARGALFQLGIIPKPPFADAMTHVFLSFDDVMEHRAEQIKAQLEAKQYLVWIRPTSGKMDENFRIGVANCAAFCACLSANYHLSAKARTEINFAADCTKHIITLVVDDESREQCWLQAHIHGKPTVDFSSPDRDEESIQELIDILGTRGMVVKRKTGAPGESPLSPMASRPQVASAKSSVTEDGSAQPPPQPGERPADTLPNSALNSSRAGTPAAKVESDQTSQAQRGGDPDGTGPTSPSRAARSSEPHLAVGHTHNGRDIPGATAPPDEEVHLWTVNQVAAWLDKTLVLGQYQQTFIDQKVDGLKLASMDDEQLEGQLHVASKLHRKKILTRVARLVGL